METYMKIETYAVTLTGLTPLLMHADNIAHADEMQAWKEDPNNKKLGKAGDDRTPAWRWIGCLYHDGQRVVMPFENIQRAIMDGGAMVPTGRGIKTFKSQTQSGIAVPSDFVLTVRGQEIGWPDIFGLKDEKHFGLHIAKARELGFSLFVKRAKIGMSKHIRVRPRFDDWRLDGIVQISDEQITKPILEAILTAAGTYKGLGDWRPGGKTPGNYGMFEAKVRPA